MAFPSPPSHLERRLSRTPPMDPMTPLSLPGSVTAEIETPEDRRLRRTLTPYPLPRYLRGSSLARSDHETLTDSYFPNMHQSPDAINTLQLARSHDSVRSDQSPKKRRPCLDPVLLRDLIMGFSDGLTVPFALTAGLSAIGSPRIVLIAGLAEIFAGAISMGLGAYMAASTDRTRYRAVVKKVRVEATHDVDHRVRRVLHRYGISGDLASNIAAEMKENPESMVEFILNFDLQLQSPEINAIWLEGLFCGLSYWVAGFLPIIPYMMPSIEPRIALAFSICIAAVALLVFGYIKGRWSDLTRRNSIKSAIHMLIVGAAAAGASYGAVKLMDVFGIGRT